MCTSKQKGEIVNFCLHANSTKCANYVMHVVQEWSNAEQRKLEAKSPVAGAHTKIVTVDPGNSRVTTQQEPLQLPVRV